MTLRQGEWSRGRRVHRQVRGGVRGSVVNNVYVHGLARTRLPVGHLD